MNYDPEIHHRRSIRLKGYDYAMAGAYFVTLCVQGREPLFGEIAGGGMILNDGGRVVEQAWLALSERFPNVALDEWVIMPNHFHGILLMDCRGESCIRPTVPNGQGDHKDRPYGTASDSLGRILQAFKSKTTNAYIHGVQENGWPPFPGRLWQRNYYERVLRNEAELDVARRYIQDNPRKWAEDRENPVNVPST